MLELPVQLATLTRKDADKKLPDKIRAFVEGSELSASDRVKQAKNDFLFSILLHAKLPLDPREEIKFMIDALEEVQKALPKRKPGRKEDQSITQAWKRIDFEKMKYREAYRLYMLENSIKDFNRYAFQAFQDRIRKKRSEEKKKQAKKTVAANIKTKASEFKFIIPT